MFIEGIINIKTLKTLKTAGYDIVWEACTKEKLKEKGYLPTLEGECAVRIFLDKDIEDAIFKLGKIKK